MSVISEDLHPSVHASSVVEDENLVKNYSHTPPQHSSSKLIDPDFV